jgi:Family of unknown function (DUF5677)
MTRDRDAPRVLTLAVRPISARALAVVSPPRAGEPLRASPTCAASSLDRMTTVPEHFHEIVARALERTLGGRTETEVERFLEKGGVSQMLNESIPTVSRQFADSLIEAMPAMIAHRREFQTAVAEEVQRVQGDGLDLVEALLKMADESGEEFVDRYFKDADGIPIMPWVLAHLQARACRIGEEALLLLRAGLGLGAFARWRSLNEVAVVGTFISQQGDDVALRYFEHIEVDQWLELRAAEESGRISDDELRTLAETQDEVDKLSAKYGASFLADYGWAADALAGSEHRGFRAIEHAADFGHLRFDYRRASGEIHASAAKVLTPPDARDPYRTMLSGPSLLWIATPAHAVALSLCVTTNNLLASVDNPGAVFLMAAMSDIAERAGIALIAAEAELEGQEVEGVSSDGPNGGAGD